MLLLHEFHPARGQPHKPVQINVWYNDDDPTDKEVCERTDRIARLLHGDHRVFKILAHAFCGDISARVDDKDVVLKFQRRRRARGCHDDMLQYVTVTLKRGRRARVQRGASIWI